MRGSILGMCRQAACLTLLRKWGCSFSGWRSRETGIARAIGLPTRVVKQRNRLQVAWGALKPGWA